MLEINKLKNKTRFMMFVGIMSIIALSPEISNAATALASVPGQNELGSVYNNFKGLITGTVGRIIGLTSLLIGTIGAAVSSNLRILIPTGGIAFAVGAGPSVVESVMGAIF